MGGISPPDWKRDSSRANSTLHICGVFFIVAFVWHSRVLAYFYNVMGREWAAAISFQSDKVHLFQESFEGAHPAMLRAFALSSTISHTFIFWYGLEVSKAVMAAESHFSILKQRKELVLATYVLLAAIFHALVLIMFNFIYKVDFWPITIFADLFFERQMGREPFAWISSVSYSLAYVFGFFIARYADDRKRFENFVLLGSKFLKRRQVGILAVFLIWLSSFDVFLIPALQQARVTFELENSILHQDVKYLGFVFGIIVSSLIPVTIDAMISPHVLPQPGSVFALDRTWKQMHFGYSVLSNLVVCSVISSFLVSLVVHRGDFDATNVATDSSNREVELLYWKGGLVFFAGTTISVLIKELMFIISKRSATVRAATTYGILFSFWMIYLVFYIGSGMPFMLLSILYRLDFVEHWANTDSTKYSTDDYTVFWSWVDWLKTTTCITYVIPVVGQGILKITVAKMKAKWSWKHDAFIISLNLVPAAFIIAREYNVKGAGFPIIIMETILHAFYVSFTWRNRPEHTGHRESKTFEEFIQPLISLIEEYFDFNVVFKSFDSPESSEKSTRLLDDEKPRILGFHPHGVYPVSMGWQPVSKTFRKVLGDTKVHSCSDAFTQCIPGMRDMLQLLGGIEVHKPSLERFLREGKTILLVPGGQGEILLHTRHNLDNNLVKVCARHKGFIRLALSGNAELVPMFNFGELQSMQNVYMPRIQAFCRKWMAFPFPFLPVGLFKCLPIPKRVKMTLAVAEPIYLKCATAGQPTNEEVDKAYRLYFTRFRKLFEETKAEAGFSELKLILVGAPADLSGVEALATASN